MRQGALGYKRFIAGALLISLLSGCLSQPTRGLTDEDRTRIVAMKATRNQLVKLIVNSCNSNNELNPRQQTIMGGDTAVFMAAEFSPYKLNIRAMPLLNGNIALNIDGEWGPRIGQPGTFWKTIVIGNGATSSEITVPISAREDCFTVRAMILPAVREAVAPAN